MASVDLLRKLIREEVRAVFQEELAGILKEAVMGKGVSKVVVEGDKPKKTTIPGTLNTKPFKPTVAPNLGNNNPLSSLLAETAQAMSVEEYRDFNYTSEDIHNFGIQQYTQEAVVNDISGMLATARPSSNLDAIQINAVPDYTDLMNNLKAKGAI